MSRRIEPTAMTYRLTLTALAVALAACAATAQVSTTDSVVPRRVNYSGVAKDENGKLLTGVVGATFAIYAQQEGGAALWIETQNVQADDMGSFSAMLGATRPEGIPQDVFSSGQARWLRISYNGGAEQARIALLSVPYALKAGDAQTLGGLPPSAFVLAATSSSSLPSVSTEISSPSTAAAPPPAGSVTGTGTADFVPLWTSTSAIGNSVLFQTGSGGAAKVGINTTSPEATVDVKGTTNLDGLLTSPVLGAATSAAGKSSQAHNFVASSFNSGTSAAVNQTFQWKAEAAENNTTTPSATLNLLFGSGTAQPAETGLKLSNKGLFTFAGGQTFPGTGTISGITTASGSGLAGGGATGTLHLSVPGAGITNSMLQHSTLTLTAGGGMTGGGAVVLGGSTTLGLKNCSANQVLQFIGSAWTCATLGGSGTLTGVTAGTDLTGGGTSGNVTLNLDTTKVPQLLAANTFVGNQTVMGNITGSGQVQGGQGGVLINDGAGQTMQMFVNTSPAGASAGTLQFIPNTGTLVGTEAYSVGLMSGTFGDFYCHHGLVGGGAGVCYFADVANDSGHLPNSFSQAAQFDSVDSSGTDIFTSIRANPQNSIEVSSGSSPGTSFGTIRQVPTVFANLPTCGPTVEGTTATVTDSATNTWGAIATGSGTNHVLTYCDGTNWTVSAK
jgi:hypothetical protein